MTKQQLLRERAACPPLIRWLHVEADGSERYLDDEPVSLPCVPIRQYASGLEITHTRADDEDRVPPGKGWRPSKDLVHDGRSVEWARLT
jgi:hypothetical protein